MRRNKTTLLTGVIVGIATSCMAVAITQAQNMEHMTVGKAHYIGSCASCHGFTGAGDGPQATGMSPPPTNFRTATPSTLSDNTIEQAILAGKANTSMPSFATVFHGDDVREILTYVRSLAVTP
jgi:mono/diheme cytochrome c family protein